MHHSPVSCVSGVLECVRNVSLALAVLCAGALASDRLLADDDDGSSQDLPEPSASQLRLQELELGVLLRLPPGREAGGDVHQWLATATGAGARYVVLAVPRVGEGGSLEAVRDLLGRFEAACRSFELPYGLELAAEDLPRARAEDSDQAPSPSPFDRLLDGRESLLQIRLRGESAASSVDWNRCMNVAARLAPPPLIHQWWRPASYDCGPSAPFPCFYVVRLSDVASRVAPELAATSSWLVPICSFELSSAEGGLSLASLLRAYYRSVGRGAGLLLGVDVSSDGHVGEQTVRLLEAFGKEVSRRFGAPLESASGRGAELELRPLVAPEADHVVVSEDLSGGQRVRQYLVELDDGSGWRAIGGGQSVGQKRIHWFEPSRVTRLRVRALVADGEPRWRELSLHAAASGPSGELYRQVKARLQVGGSPRDCLRELATVEKRVPAFGPLHVLRAFLFEREDLFEDAVSELDLVLDLEPSLQTLYHQRAGLHFRLEHFDESVRDYDLWLRSRGPRASDACWQRGLAWYYAGDYAAGQRQFEGYHRVGPLDIENGLWRFLCMAEREGIEKARAAAFEYSDPVRLPFPALLDLYLGKGSVAAVLQQATEGVDDPDALNESLFYAHYYVAKYLELKGEMKQALSHAEKALTHRIDHFMYDCCRIDTKRIRARVEESK